MNEPKKGRWVCEHESEEEAVVMAKVLWKIELCILKVFNKAVSKTRGLDQNKSDYGGG